MDVRSATSEDCSRIEAVARASLQASYALSPADIDTLVRACFSEAALRERIDDPDTLCLVADDGDVVGFTEVDADSTLRWMHVDPAARGRGAGTALFERGRQELTEREVPVTARILKAASEGGQFLESFGLTRTGTTQLELDREQFDEHVYATTGTELEANEPSVEVPETVSVDDRVLTVDTAAEVPGTLAPFFELVDDETTDSRWGFFCTECGSTDVAADGLDRLECAACGNTHLAEQWDGAYL